MEDKVPEEKQNSPKRLKWFPGYVSRLTVVFLIVLAAIVYLAINIQVPFLAPDEVPLPDEGMNVPGPEWIFLLLWQGFWFFTGSKKKYLPIMPISAVVFFLIMLFMPFWHKIPFGKIPGLGSLLAKISAMKHGIKKSFLYALPVFVFGFVLAVAIYRSGHQAKILGCDSCHNPAMGARQAIPPADPAKYYFTDRARQIGVGKYRAGKLSTEAEGGKPDIGGAGEAGGYKDADWQMRHMYEPTFTW